MASGNTSKEYKLAIKIAGAVSSSFNSAVGDAGAKLTNLGSIAQRAAAVAAAAWGALKLGQFISDAIEVGSEYENTFAKVQTIMDQTAMSTDTMSSAITALSNETGVAAAELSDSVYNAISATGDTANAVSLVGDATKLATAGFAESEDALSVLTTVMNAYGMTADEASKISDSLIMTQNRGVTTVGDLAGSMGKAIATASAYSVDLTNLEASYISLTKAGISTEESTTYLSSMLKELGSSSTKVSKIIKSETGKSFGQLMGEGHSLGDVLEILQKSVNGDSEALINLWSSAEAGKAANAVASQGIDYFRESLDALNNSTGLTEEAYKTMAQTFQFQSQLIKTNWDNLKISVFDSLKEPLARVLEQVNGVMPAVQGAISGSAEGIGNFVASALDYAIPRIAAFKDRAVELFGMAFEGIENVIEGHSGTFDKLNELGGRLKSAFGCLMESAQPVLDYIFGTALPQIADNILSVVDKLADLGLYLSEHKELVKAVIGVFAGFKTISGFSFLLGKLDTASKTLEAFQKVTQGTSLAASAASGKLPKLASAFGVLTGKIKPTDIAAEAVNGKLEALKGGLNAFSSIGKNAFSGLKSGFTSIGTTLSGLGSKIMGFVAANPAALVIAAIVAVIAIVVTLYNKCEWFRNAVNNAIAAVVGFFQNAWENIKQVWQAVSGWFQANVIQPLVNFFTPIIETLGGIFRGCWIIIQAVWQIVSSWFQTNVIQPLVNFFSTAVQVISGFFSGLWSGIQFIWQTVSGWFQANVIQPLIGFFAPMVESISGFFASLWSNICTVWQAAGSWFSANVATPIKNAFSSVGSFVRGVFNNIIGFVEKMINSVVGGINKFIGGFNGVVGKAAAVVGTSWEGIASVPSVSLPRLAKGGIVSAPTILEAGEAGTEAIIPLGELWGQMREIISGIMNGATDRIATLADQLDAAGIGSQSTPLSELLESLRADKNDPEPGGNTQPPIMITYSPVYHFDGDAPSKEELVEAETISQDEFNRMAFQWMKEIGRKNFKGAVT